MAKLKSPAVKEVWRSTALITVRELWFKRNRMVYDEEPCNVEDMKRKILFLTTESEVRMKALMWNSVYDLQVLKHFGMKTRKVKSVQVKEVYFELPKENQVMLCCDGASKGNPGVAGFGFIGRISSGEVVVAVEGGIGIATNFVAEVLALLNAGEWAVSKGKQFIIFRTDSMAVIKAFSSGKMPWYAQARWKKICSNVTSWEFIHSLREVNFSADTLAKRGAALSSGEQKHYDTRPSFLSKIEMPDKVYYKFV